MLLGRVCLLLAGELLKGADYAEPCVAWLDDIIDVAITCCLVRIAEKIVVLFLLLFCDAGLFCRVFGLGGIWATVPLSELLTLCLSCWLLRRLFAARFGEDK